jgi:hypothetical protein
MVVDMVAVVDMPANTNAEPHVYVELKKPSSSIYTGHP